MVGEGPQVVSPIHERPSHSSGGSGRATATMLIECADCFQTRRAIMMIAMMMAMVIIITKTMTTAWFSATREGSHFLFWSKKRRRAGRIGDHSGGRPFDSREVKVSLNGTTVRAVRTRKRRSLPNVRPSI